MHCIILCNQLNIKHVCRVGQITHDSVLCVVSLVLYLCSVCEFHEESEDARYLLQGVRASQNSKNISKMRLQFVIAGVVCNALRECCMQLQ